MADFIYRGHDREGALDRLQSAGLLAVDMESVSLDDLTPVGIGVYWGDNEGAYFPMFPEVSPHIGLVLSKTSDERVRKIYHNGIGFDLEVLDRFGRAEGYEPPDDRNIEDSSIMAQVSGLPAGLQRLGEEWLGAGDLFSISDLFKEYGTRTMLGVPVERAAEKCLNDCRTTWELYRRLNGEGGRGISPLDAARRGCYDTDRQLIHVLRRISRRGLGLRKGLLEEHRERLERDLIRIRRECENEGFNPGSPQQVGFVLAHRGNVLPLTKSKKQLKTDDEILEGLDDELASIVLDYRRAQKLLSSYVLPWIDSDRAYTHLRLDLATGRLGSGKINGWDSVNRNLQNVPPGMREIFKPDEGIWTWADHGQIELRCLAYISRDRAMMDEYAKSNPDLHKMTAEAAGISRQAGKTFNFARVFGAGDKKLSASSGVPIQRVKAVRAVMASLYPESERWIRQQMEWEGEYVETAWGRRCRLPEMQPGVEYNERAFKAHVGKCAVNYPCQGTAADIVKRNMLTIFEEIGDRMCLQVHDEFLVDGDYEFPDRIAHVHPELPTPFEVKRGPIWS